MLASIGAQSIDDLFASFRAIQAEDSAALPARFLSMRSSSISSARAENSCGYTSFLGAGVYNHLLSVVTDALIQRGEFLTSYTPYQAEISQGTLQAIFEFQTLMCERPAWRSPTPRCGRLDRTTEAVLMAERLTGRRRVVVARSLHPEYRQVLDTYTRNLGLHIQEVGFTATGQMDAARLEAAIDSETAAVVVQSPNFWASSNRWRTWRHGARKRSVGRDSRDEGVSLGAVRRGRRRHRGHGSAELRLGAKLRRTLRRRDRHARQICRQMPDA